MRGVLGDARALLGHGDGNYTLLKPIVLQVVEVDQRGPITLRVLEQGETVDLADERSREFLIAWVKDGTPLQNQSILSLTEELFEIRKAQARLGEQRILQDRAIEQAQRELAALESDNAQKTEALRVLQRERDPGRLEQQITERVATATRQLEADLADMRRAVTVFTQERDELRAAKRKLREALERAKGKR